MLGRRAEAKQKVHGDGFPQLAMSIQRSVHALILDGWLGDGVSSARSNIFPNI